MTLMESPSTPLAFALVALLGCSGGEAPTAGGPGTGDSVRLDAFCEGSCATRAPDGCLGQADCASYCRQHASAWATAVGEAFARCTATQPLCYERVEDCILRELHPAGVPVRVTLSGSGFGADDGKVVRAWHDPERALPFGGEATIKEGRFSFEWTAPFGASSTTGPLLLLYIDSDGDGRCRAGADVTHSVYGEWDGGFLAPAYAATLAPPLSDADFVCSVTP